MAGTVWISRRWTRVGVVDCSTPRWTLGAAVRFRISIDSLARRVVSRLGGDPNAVRTALTPVAQITTSNLDAFHLYDRGARLIDRLDFTAARVELAHAIAIDSTFGLAHSRLAYVYWWLGDSQREERAERARAFALLDRIPERERYHLRAQGAMEEGGGLEAARAVLMEMERFYPEDKEMLFDIGDYSSHLNEFPTAIEYLDRVVAMDPAALRALQHLAKVYLDMGRFERSLEWAQRYADADSTHSYRLLGDAQVAAGRGAEGLETLLRGRALDPRRDFDFTLSLTNAYFHLRRAGEARSEWDRLMRTSPPIGESAAIWHARAWAGSTKVGIGKRWTT